MSYMVSLVCVYIASFQLVELGTGGYGRIGLNQKSEGNTKFLNTKVVIDKL